METTKERTEKALEFLAKNTKHRCRESRER